MIEIVNITRVEVLGDTRLRVGFSNGTVGERDFAGLLAEGGPMIEPLRSPLFFRRVFIQCGVLTWPNGFDLDAIQLHLDMRAAGHLTGGGPSHHVAE